MTVKIRDRRQVALRWRRTKIIATLGPASSSTAMIEQLIDAGVNLVRINMSHGDQDSQRKTIDRVRLAARETRRHIGILMDLCGTKIRVGRFEHDSIMLEAGSTVVVTTRNVTGTDGLVPSQYRSLHKRYATLGSTAQHEFYHKGLQAYAELIRQQAHSR